MLQALLVFKSTVSIKNSYIEKGIFGMGRGASVMTQENITKFVNYVSNHPEEALSSMKLADYMNVSKTSIHNFWQLIPDKLGGDVSAIPGKGVIWNPKVTLKNSEGYSDPTAEKAIAKVDGTITGSVMKKGQVWNCQNTSTSAFFLIIAERPTYCVGLNLYSDEDLAGKKECVIGIRIKDSAAVWYVDPCRLTSKPKKYMKDYMSDIEPGYMLEIESVHSDIFPAADPSTKNDLAEIKEQNDEIASLKDTILSQEKIIADLEGRIEDLDRLATSWCKEASSFEQKNQQLEDEFAAYKKEHVVKAGEIDMNTRLYIRELETKVGIYEKLMFK